MHPCACYESYAHYSIISPYMHIYAVCSYSGTQPVHTHQLNDIHAWTTDFRDTTLADNEIVLFDILAGDFNLDNSSDGKRMFSDAVTS